MINKRDVIANCRILGISVSASKEEIKQARNRLAKIYHPDKYPNISADKLKAIEAKFNIVSNAYLYLVDNHASIQHNFQYVENFSLTSKAHTVLRSHYVYSEVANF
ncbi:MAG: DnaJ domain-containing protein [Francisellaceae bacterium]|jgi:DnaJ-class molecular chaperone|nr:DnaJ domain-containing protein [Francisellaceae bacterium]MBT6207661.1 DnaJ domain-containing protein [Francisellaceae bacterium]MBT6538072.1 DnaJ domain-containing protein [Francisellaceae bacterium]